LGLIKEEHAENPEKSRRKIKNEKMKIKLFLILLLIAEFSFAQEQRGIKIIDIKIDGKSDTLYKQSHALVIGMSDYTNGWPILQGVKNDIVTVKTALEQEDFDVMVLENATKEQVDKSISDFISKYGQESENRLLFYFAGHGHTIKTNYGEELGYIVSIDAPNPNKDAAGFQAKAIEMVDFEKYAKRIQSKHALFLFDACFSGSLFSLTRAAPEIISYKTSQPVRQFITSGSANETVPDVSIFCKQFVSAINSNEADANKDGYVTGTELGDYLQTTVVNYSYNAQHPQYGKIRNPNLDKGDFVFVLNKQQINKANIQLKEMTIDETPLISYGTLVLSSEISGQLYIDSIFKKQLVANTQITINNIQTGSHNIEIKGSENWTQSVTVFKDQQVQLTAQSKKIEIVQNEIPIVTYGSLVLTTEIDGQLFIDGNFEKLLEANTKITIGNLTTGQHNIEIKGNENWAQTITIIKYQETQLSAHSTKVINKPPELKTVSLENTETAFGLNLKMIKIKGDTFTMGYTGNQSSDCDSNERPSHIVILSDYYMGMYEVTQKQWKQVMGNNPSYTACDDCPVNQVSWDDIQEFLIKLNAKTGKKYALPTEAQWEFAARGGSTSKGYTYSGSNNLSEVSIFNSKALKPIGMKIANELGIYDMSGNVWEWCSDWYENYKTSSQTDPKGPDYGTICVLRGGSWASDAQECRTTFRSSHKPNSKYGNGGFRLVRVP
jgi:formylglycine-generating enzyme required for sulfatase activity